MADDSADRLTALGAVLRSAAALLDGILGQDNPRLTRLLRVFSRMPPPDREPILRVLEQEVDLRLLAEQTDGVLTGPRPVRPNPGARLYLRLHETQTPWWRPEEMLTALIQAARMVVSVVEGAPESRAEWTTCLREALRGLAARERAAVAQLIEETLAAIRAVDAEQPAEAEPALDDPAAAGAEGRLR